MKKFFAVAAAPILAITLLLSTACGTGADAEGMFSAALQLPMSADVSSDAYVFHMDQTESGTTMTLQAPETLAGLVLKRTADGTEAEYGGIRIPLPAAAAKKIFLLDDALTCLRNALNEKKAVWEETENGFLLTAADDAVSCRMLLTAEGSITSVTAEANGRESTFEFIDLKKESTETS